jgi:hypothetical protein
VDEVQLRKERETEIHTPHSFIQKELVTMKSGVRFLAKLGAIAAFALGVAIASQTGASASQSEAPASSPAVVAAPSISATPTSGLASGATVQLTGTGLTPGTVYFVGECAAVSATSYACNDATNAERTANASGTISAPIVVHSSFTGTTGSGTTHAINCKTTTCVVAAYSASFEGGAVPISFN